MDRRNFIKASCMTCIAFSIPAILQSCTGVKYAGGELNDNGILVELKEFESRQGAHSYIIVRHDDLQYPICVYRINETTYSAVLMRCTHQGAELQVAGDQLTCPAHGSEFDKWGRVTQSPAATDLRSFPVTVASGKLFIDLRKQA